MQAVAVALAFIASMWAGVYLIVHDHATIGAWVCILTLFAEWNAVSETNKKK